MDVDTLIRRLRDLKKADPTVGKKPVFAGDTNLISVEALAVSGEAVVLTDKP